MTEEMQQQRQAASESSNPETCPDEVLSALAAYAFSSGARTPLAYETARLALMDALGCAMLALRYPECAKLLGPLVPGTMVPGGVRVPGTQFVLDPVRAAFNIGAMIRWLDYNDTWLAAEWGHPSDNIAAILAAADYAAGSRNLSMRDVLDAIIKAYEIQGVLALGNSLNRRGLDHVLFVKIASAAVSAQLMGGSETEIRNAISQAWIDNASLRVYRHGSNTGSRKSWAAGDAASRGLYFAEMSLRGEMGYPNALTAPGWGFKDAVLGGKPVTLERALGCYVIENILFKVSYPAEFHAQTAVEAAVKLHSEVAGRIDQIEKIELTTQESAIRIIDKKGPLTNPAARDHCLQYMVAIGLISGSLSADDYEDSVAADPRIDLLRSKMTVVEDSRYTEDYLDPEKRSIANAIQVFFSSGEVSAKVEVEYPIGHKRRRGEAKPLLEKKFIRNMEARFPRRRAGALASVFSDQAAFKKLSVRDFMSLWTI